MTTWFTSDTHFWHKQIIPYCNRPVPGLLHAKDYKPEECVNIWTQNAHKMNEWLIQRWNEKVKPDDEVWHLGDWAFCGKTKFVEILERLNGRKHAVLGNHDYGHAKTLEVFCDSVQHYKMLRVNATYKGDDGKTVNYHQPIVLCHFPILSWDGMAHGSWHLHGHCHGSLPDNGSLRLDVGVDPMGWYPISFEELRAKMALRTVVPVDHHR